MHGYAKITKSERLLIGNTGIEAIGRVPRRTTQRTQGMNNDDESVIEIDDSESDLSVILNIDDTDDEKEVMVRSNILCS